jgi:sulfoxide reductase heme-binding subunit YedZ
MLMDRVNGAARKVPVWAAYLLGLVPLMSVVWLAINNDLGADPVQTLERHLGLLALRFLILTLCITPLRRHVGLNLIRFRRSLGVLTFSYAALHLLVWVTLDLSFRWGEIGTALTRRPFIIVGMIAFVVMVPLVLTSNNWSVRRLGAAAWQRLHKLTYVAAALGALHFVMLSKVWNGELIVYTVIVTLLLTLRLVPSPRRRAVSA